MMCGNDIRSCVVDFFFTVGLNFVGYHNNISKIKFGEQGILFNQMYRMFICISTWVTEILAMW